MPWTAPVFTAHWRGNDPAAVAWQESDRLHGHESGRAYRLTDRIRHLRGKPPLPRTTLDERRRALEVIAADPVYRGWVALRSLRSGKRPGGPALPPPTAPGAAPAELPLGLSARIDDAIETLRTSPWEEIQRRGWNFQPNHFYWPLNDAAFLEANRELWHDRGAPRDIDWDEPGQRELRERLAAYEPELADVPVEDDPARPAHFVWHNNAFGGDDAKAYYGIVRDLAPKRVVEIGCGWSSLVLARALDQTDAPTQVTQIEPFPNERLFAALPPDWKRHESILQHAPSEPFEALEAGDVLFYDGSHCSSTASDVNWFFFEVLPRLAPGVWVHIHDLFFPDDYHDSWILEEGLSWNEQYLLQAFLMNNDSWKVRLANHMLGGDGGSVWLERMK